MFLLISFNCFAQTEFITTWQTTTASESITIPTNGGGYNCTVDWGDGSGTTTHTGSAPVISHTYATANTYTVTITGTFNRIYFNNTGDKNKIQSIEQWGTNQVWFSMVRAFDGCANLVNNATDVPDLSSCGSTLRMFRNATSIGTGSATNWNSWNLNNVTSIAQMFRNCPSFNEDISNWDVSNVTNFNNLFNGASSFNQDVSGWITSSATRMNNTFRDAVAFDQDISGWDISGVTTMNNILRGAELSLENYNTLLVGWNAQSLQPSIAFHGGTSKYCSPAAVAAKANMISSDSWTFTDGGELTEFVWTGNTDTDWNTPDNWQDGYISDCSLDVTIPVVTNYPTIDASSEFAVDNLTVDSGASLTIEGGLTVQGNLTTNNGLTLNSGGSIIVDGTSSGNLTYNRNLPNGNEYYNTASPVIGETIENFISTNSPKTGISGNIGLYYYDNSATTGYAGTGYVFYEPTSTGSMESAKGYGVQLSSGSDIAFTGTMPTADASIAIATGSIDNSVLVGNPFPSYLPVNENTVTTDNILTQNSALLSEETVWFWDNTINDYIAVNNGSPSRYLAPGQGFFVDAGSSGSFNFLESWQEHQTTDVFNKTTDDTFRVYLTLENQTNQKKSTEIYFIPNKTIYFDNGYDSSSISDENASFSLATRLVVNLDSQNLSIQTLPTENIEETVIPLSVNGEHSLTFSIDYSNKPKNINIYLEDRLLNSFIFLGINGSYTIINEEKTTGVGRFYLHTKSKVLSTR
ncbi:BspA family leucine-rich repeat surface protein, partial [Polaribacter sp.]|uniref:BspA family leucine-rich repeat surface protein n=1 Tax=Polaribacter sp. TaxID=1920175 RepID=UPI003F6CDE8D